MALAGAVVVVLIATAPVAASAYAASEATNPAKDLAPTSSPSPSRTTELAPTGLPTASTSPTRSSSPEPSQTLSPSASPSPSPSRQRTRTPRSSRSSQSESAPEEPPFEFTPTGPPQSLAPIDLGSLRPEPSIRASTAGAQQEPESPGADLGRLVQLVLGAALLLGLGGGVGLYVTRGH